MVADACRQTYMRTYRHPPLPPPVPVPVPAAGVLGTMTMTSHTLTVWTGTTALC